jgi:hypothetical protein
MELEQEIEKDKAKEQDLSYLMGILLGLTESFDPELRKMRTARNRTLYKNWVIQLLMNSIFSLKGISPNKDDIMTTLNKLSGNAVVIWALAVLGISAPFIIAHAPKWLWVISVVMVVNSARVAFGRMLTIGDEYFNIQAYQKCRPKEEAMISTLLTEQAFSFKALYDAVRENRPVEIALTKASEEMKRALDRSDLELDEAKKALQQKEDSYHQLIQDFTEHLDLYAELSKQNAGMERAFEYALNVLHRLAGRAPRFNAGDLKNFSDFSLFEQRKNRLHMLAENGTTDTPETIDLDDPKYADYAAVIAVKTQISPTIRKSDREGRSIGAYYLQLSDRKMVYNFHFSTTDEQMYAIIKSKEMYRLISGILIHLIERGLLIKREGDKHGAE